MHDRPPPRRRFRRGVQPWLLAAAALVVATTAAMPSTAIAAPPVLAAPAVTAVNAGEASPISGITVADGDSLATDPMTLTLSVAAGTLAASPGGLALSIAGNGSATLVITGALAVVQVFLASPGALAYTSAIDASGDVGLTITAVDVAGETSALTRTLQIAPAPTTTTAPTTTSTTTSTTTTSTTTSTVPAVTTTTAVSTTTVAATTTTARATTTTVRATTTTARATTTTVRATTTTAPPPTSVPSATTSSLPPTATTSSTTTTEPMSSTSSTTPSTPTSASATTSPSGPTTSIVTGSGIGDAESGGALGGSGSSLPEDELIEELASGGLRLIGVQQLAPGTAVDGVPVGGLSGIDHDPVSDRWVAISDDRSEFGPARFYDLTVEYTADRVDPVEIAASNALRQEDGTPYPAESDGGEVPDAESIRVDPTDGTIWWTTEGSRTLSLDSMVVHASADGVTLATVSLPAIFATQSEDIGTRDNAALEGLTFATDLLSMYAIVEGPLLQDDEAPTADSGATVRIVQYDLAGDVIAQYPYELDPLQGQPAGEFASEADNGASEILAVAGSQLLVLERAGTPQADGTWESHIRLYLVDLSAATDVNGVDALAGGTFTPAAKSLLLDFDDLGIDIDNIEGLTWGPPLENGHRTLVAVSDDNFNDAQVTQFLVFELVPA